MNVTGLCKVSDQPLRTFFFWSYLFFCFWSAVGWSNGCGAVFSSGKRSEAERNESVKRFHASEARHFEKGGRPVVAACFQSGGKFRKSCGPDENGGKGENQRSISAVILIQTLETAGPRPEFL
jgi:hypothetical protein